MFFKIRKLTAIALLAGMATLAQGYESEVDSAWIASQNGGSTEFNDGNSDENPGCIGDGCGEADASASTSAAEVAGTSAAEVADSTAAKSESVTASKSANADSDEEEDCTPADSLLPECNDLADANFSDNDDDDDTYDRYINENAADARASREGFTKAIELGFRIAGGVNKLLGPDAGDWKIGLNVEGSIVAQTRIGNNGFSISTELGFSYRRYTYESRLSFDDYTENNDGTIDMALFEIPVVLKYAFGDGNFFMGVGVELGLKLTDQSKLEQSIETEQGIDNDEIDNAMPTAGLEFSGVLTFGYIINRNIIVDLRAMQNVTEFLNEDVVAVTNMPKTKLLGLNCTLGVTLLL